MHGGKKNPKLGLLAKVWCESSSMLFNPIIWRMPKVQTQVQDLWPWGDLRGTNKLKRDGPSNDRWLTETVSIWHLPLLRMWPQGMRYNGRHVCVWARACPSLESKLIIIFKNLWSRKRKPLLRLTLRSLTRAERQTAFLLNRARFTPSLFFIPYDKLVYQPCDKKLKVANFQKGWCFKNQDKSGWNWVLTEGFSSTYSFPELLGGKYVSQQVRRTLKGNDFTRAQGGYGLLTPSHCYLLLFCLFF